MGRLKWKYGSINTKSPLAGRAIWSRQFKMCPSLPSSLEQIQRGQNSFSLPFVVARRAQSSAHKMRGDEHPGQGHNGHPAPGGLNPDNHSWNSGGFQQSGNVSHGHVAGRSDANQKYRIWLLLLQQVDPLRPGLPAQKRLGANANK